MNRSKVREAVIQALNNARENDEFCPGGNLYQMTAEQVADDLAAFDADLEDVAPIDIQPHVAEWMSQQQWLERADARPFFSPPPQWGRTMKGFPQRRDGGPAW